ncbi:MAG: hypothetical protein KKD73_13080 [Proteobacteria bacterium]|nr:hypothetical protein [Pseudomonadota bacterium]MBU1639880.1 hypothetical protein [Pseudomonadota bacterium]
MGPGPAPRWHLDSPRPFAGGYQGGPGPGGCQPCGSWLSRGTRSVAREAGAFPIRIADTVGIADPAMIAELVELLAGYGLEVAVHYHNDFGMATANTINAFAHIAKWGDVTLL